MIIEEKKNMTESEKLAVRNSNFLYTDNAFKTTPHIIESGKVDFWSYRKWSNGVAECWGEFNLEVTNNGEYFGGNIYSTDLYLPDGLFIEPPMYTYAMRVGRANTIQSIYQSASTEVVICSALSTATGEQSCRISITCKGRWTEETSAGDYDDIPVVDLTYNPQSLNAQSGKAVSEAINELNVNVNNTFSPAIQDTNSGDITLAIDDISPVNHDLGVKVRGKNLFDKDNANILTTYFTASGDVLDTNSKTTRSIWIPCSPNTTYTVSKIASARFAVGFTNEEPMNGVTVNNVTFLPTATEITVTSNNNDKYIIVWFYHSSYDTSVTVEEILASMQLELGTTATAYTPYVDLATVTVSRYGKNLFDKSISFDDYNIYQGGYRYIAIYVGIGTTVTVSVLKKYNPGERSGYFYCTAFKREEGEIFPESNTKWIYSNTVAGLCNKSQTMVSENGYISLFMTSSSYNAFKDEILVEIGSNATEYELYIQPQIIQSDSEGTVSGLKSVSPNMTILADTDEVVLNCTYNADTKLYIDNKIAELTK